MIKYLGSKRLLLPHILKAVRSLHHIQSVFDAFSGTARVAHMLKSEGYRVVANDHNAYSHTLARCYVEADEEKIAAPASKLITELQRLPGRPGYFTHTYCEQSRFFSRTTVLVSTPYAKR